jgi:ABC-type glycerol-3-phosphate transport system substrate-binding protein
LQEGALQRLFLLYGQAKAAGVFPATLLETASLEDCWTAYSEGRVAIANVSARRYLASRDTLKNTGYGAPPGWNGPAVPVASGWAVAILTTDPVRQRAAAAWIDWLTSTDRLSAWTQAAGWLPATQRAWAGWGSSAYYEFLQGQLAVAVPRPTGLSDPEAVAQLQKGIDAVLREDATPADAARMVLTPEAR